MWRGTQSFSAPDGNGMKMFDIDGCRLSELPVIGTGQAEGVRKGCKERDEGIGDDLRFLYFLGAAKDMGHAAVFAFMLIARRIRVMVVVFASLALFPIVMEAEGMGMVMVWKDCYCLHQQADHQDNVCPESSVHDCFVMVG